MNPVTYDILAQRIAKIRNLPVMPRILSELAESLSLPPQSADIHRIVKTISHDKSLAAQCLRIANSALYRQRGDVTSLNDAVICLGLWRLRDLAFSCGLPQIFPVSPRLVGKEVFWRHGLGTASIAQNYARRLELGFPDEAYLAGLLHDIGILVNATIFPEDFRDLLEESALEKVSLSSMESRVLGFSHGESGRILAELWKLPISISNVIEYHHHPERIVEDRELSLLVHFADIVSRSSGLGHGFDEAALSPDQLPAFCFEITRQLRPGKNCTNEECQVFLDHCIQEAHNLADLVFAPAPA